MDNINASLFWAIMWGIVFVLAFAAIWWNVFHIFTLIISGGFMSAFIVDYVQYKRRK